MTSTHTATVHPATYDAEIREYVVKLSCSCGDRTVGVHAHPDVAAEQARVAWANLTR